MAARTTESADSVALTITCERCRQPIMLVAGPDGVTVPNRAEFLKKHRRCLQETLRQRTSRE